MAEYVVLRNMAGARTAAPFDLARPRAGAAAVAAPEPRVEVHNLDAKGVREVAREPEVLAVARQMPTTLIKPFEAAEGDGAGAAAEGDAWGIAAVGADASSRSGEGVTVAVLDTGIDRTHPAFAGVDIVEQDFSGSGNGDRQGHGTHCAGTIFGRNVGNRRIGVARGVPKALIGKVLGDDGSGTSDMLFNGIQWAVQNGAHVISMSLGFDFPGLVERLRASGWPTELATSVALEAYRGNLRMFDALMEVAQARGPFGVSPVIVAAAGNESDRDRDPRFEIAASLPAAAEGVISVGALRKDGGGGFSVAGFSNTFPQISAPGVGILSARPGGGLRELNGTSMACPHVAGVASLWWEDLHKAGAVVPSPGAVVARLLARARTDLFADGVDMADRGAGLITSPA
jgi:subtilisin family serine protease